MSAGCLSWMLTYAARGMHGHLGSWRAVFIPSRSSSQIYNPTLLRGSYRFFTTANDTGPEPVPKKKTQDPRSRVTIGSVGRKIHQRHLQVINETGDDLGIMHRAAVLRLMDEQGLKLVPLNEHKDPPVYRLMTGKQVHEEQLKLREKQKEKAVPLQVKELTFSSDIAAHDLLTKLKQAQSWLNKKHHVKITLKSRGVASTQALDTILEQMLQQLEVTIGFVSKPQITRDGKVVRCIVRPASVKELSQTGQNKPNIVLSTDSNSESIDISIENPIDVIKHT